MAFVQETDGVVAVAGFRVGDNFAWGRFLYVDDLVTHPAHRSKGYGAIREPERKLAIRVALRQTLPTMTLYPQALVRCAREEVNPPEAAGIVLVCVPGSRHDHIPSHREFAIRCGGLLGLLARVPRDPALREHMGAPAKRCR
ncbi:hypothetical protein [Thiobacillus sp. 0-1251]|uniref:hypothetical protein n=1 Tax=Thiobacillus sp. 0-1251 TaxID=1895858 RepID=UPI00344675C1